MPGWDERVEEIEKERKRGAYGREREEGDGRGGGFDTVYRERERLGTVRVSREEDRMVEKVYKA